MTTTASSSRRTMGVPRLRMGVTTVVAAAALALAGCGASGSSEDGGARGHQNGGTDGVSAAPGKGASAGSISANVRKKQQNVPVNTTVAVTGTGGKLQDVRLTTSAGHAVRGALSSDGASWRAGSLLEPGTAYVLKASLTGDDGSTTSLTRRFHTQNLTLDQQTFASISPLNGQKVGVGFPVIVHFDVPVTNRASIEKHLSVDSQPAQQGSWHWFSSTEVHWRPQHYWKAGSTVTVHADINSVPAGNGIYGQSDRAVTFKVGDRHIYNVNMKTHQMKVYSNRKLLRTIPVTTGKPGFVTRSGIKVIVQKYEKHTMNSETIGISKDNAEYYNMKDVQWAMRMTYSGEFIHAAPWSVGSQGRENVSHGCTGMSTANADWLYHMTLVGDVVKEYGSDRTMEVTNGYGDWNMSFKEYKKGSALSSTKS
jgi:lipoprotein-anchoring transpeptidase ErfK/SrfK